MEAVSAFPLKQKEAQNEPEGVAAPENAPLKDLSSDVLEVQKIQYYTDRILQGDIPSEELQARLKGSYYTVNDGRRFLKSLTDNDYLRNSRGNVISITEDYSFKDPEVIAGIERLQSETTNAREGRQDAERIVEAIQYYTDRILQGDIPSEELQARLKGSYYTVNDGRRFLKSLTDNDYLRNSRGNVISITEDYSFKDPEVAQSIQNLSNLVISQQIPDEVRTLVKKYVDSGEQADLSRLQAILVANEIQGKGIDEVISNFVNIQRKATLQKQFYSTLFSQDAIEPALALLSDFESDNTEDLVFLATLRAKALGIRRARTTNNFAQIASSAEKDFDAALATLDTLASSQAREDQELAATLTKRLYELELATIRNNALNMISLDTNAADIYRYIDSHAIRPAISGIDYLQSQLDLKVKIGELYITIGKAQRLNRANEIRKRFTTDEVEDVLSQIQDLASETREDIAVRTQLLELYRNYIAANRPEVFDEKFLRDIESSQIARLKEQFQEADLGRNQEAFKYISQNFTTVILPLIKSLQQDPRTRDIVEGYLYETRPNGKRSVVPRLRYIQKLSDLETQRPLTDRERAYIESVELLTFFNPYLVAALSADEGVTAEYLRHHFDKISHDRASELEDGQYIPLIMVGTGPNGLAALGEITRNNPELARQTLVIDSGTQPGGPFAIPNGPAWELNSANRRGRGGYVMPSPPNGNELKSVRGYGSPVSRWYPGERVNGSSVRLGSINTTVDYLPTPDDISLDRYPTNEELQTILALQTAMLTQNLVLGTSLIKVEPNPDSHSMGNKIATLQIVDRDGEVREVKVNVDAVFVSTGLGEATYGFPLEGSRAEKVLADTEGMDGFPKLSTTLEAFNALADRTKEKRSPGQTIAIYGRGNSADTLIEFIGNIFQSENPLVRDVTKVYLITEGNLSERPRYAAINDIRPRNGRGNLIEQISSRVSDVDFADDNNYLPQNDTNELDAQEDTELSDIQGRKMILYDTRGELVLDESGSPLLADSVIAATGFRPQLETIFSEYTNGRSLRDQEEGAPLQPLTLPTNPQVAVAEYFTDDPSILLLGTASNPRFGAEKLAQLPRDAREALLRNGAENAVAVGFRAPDTQAATNAWINGREIILPKKEAEEKMQILIQGENERESNISFARTVGNDDLRIPDNIQDEELLLSPMFSYNLERAFQAMDNYTGDLEFEIRYDKDNELFNITYQQGDIEGLSDEFLSALIYSLNDDYMQRYTLNLLCQRRRDPKLTLYIAFRKGKINDKETFIQKG